MVHDKAVVNHHQQQVLLLCSHIRQHALIFPLAYSRTGGRKAPEDRAPEDRSRKPPSACTAVTVSPSGCDTMVLSAAACIVRRTPYYALSLGINYGHFGPKTLRTLDTSALVRWVRTVRTDRHCCRSVLKTVRT